MSLTLVTDMHTYIHRDTEYADLAIQLDIFDEEFVEDEEVLAGEGGMDISDHKNIFRAVCTKVNNN